MLFFLQKLKVILLMEEILRQLIGSLSHYLQVFFFKYGICIYRYMAYIYIYMPGVAGSYVSLRLLCQKNTE